MNEKDLFEVVYLSGYVGESVEAEFDNIGDARDFMREQYDSDEINEKHIMIRMNGSYDHTY